MPNIIEITDFHAPELDPYARLTQNQLRNRPEPEKGIFIAESPKVISRALDAGYQPLSLLMERKQITGPAAEILTRCGDAPVYTADRELLAALTGFELTRGVLCAFRRPAPRSVEELCKNARRVAVLEGIVDSTNVGAIFRSAAALNMDAVLINPSCCDPLCRRAVRVSMGTVFQVPWAQIGQTPADWPEKGMEQLHALGFNTAAITRSRSPCPTGWIRSMWRQPAPWRSGSWANSKTGYFALLPEILALNPSHRGTTFSRGR